jgi:3-isopropylmalate/(R)-2-methylmalate dehydratase small subunit
LTTENSVHRIWRLGSDIDTDQLAPGAYMQLGIAEIAPHCLESVRPDFACGVNRGDVLVAGNNFGIGSSREQAAAVLVFLGVKAVVAPSYSGLFFRNAFNVGLLLLTCAQADELQEGEHIRLDLKTWQIHCGARPPLLCAPVPDFLMEIVSAGGLLNHLKAHQNNTREAH